MGKKSQRKAKENGRECGVKKLSAQKRNELNTVVEDLFKLSFTQANMEATQWRQYVEIRAMLEYVQKLESDLRPKAVLGKNRTAAIDNFYEWARENDIEFDGVRIAEFPGYELGLEATRDLKRGETFITIPKRMLMSLDNVSRCVAPMLAEIPMIQSMLNINLTIALIIEKLNPNSFWRCYLDMLPDRYSTVMNFSVAEMQELRGCSRVLEAALNQCQNIARQYAFISKFIHNISVEKSDTTVNMLKERFTFDLYCWAVSTVMTRQNLVPTKLENSQKSITANGTDDMTTGPALIPFWDFANHRDGELTTGYNEALDRVESATMCDFRKGEQVFIHYGNRSGADFLVHNGFVVSDNSHDSISIRLGLCSGDKLLAERSKLLEMLEISVSGRLEVLTPPVCISPKLLGFVRVFNMDTNQITHWLASERPTDLLHVDCALDTSLEKKTWCFLQARLNLLLKAFPTTLDEDLLLLKGGTNKIGYIRSMLINYRINEKRILNAALDYVNQRIIA